MDARLFRLLSYQDTAHEVVLTELEWMALLFVPLTPVEQLDFGAAAQALAYGESLRIGATGHASYEAERTAFLNALAALARLPGGVRFGRVHFGNDEEWTIAI